MKAKPKPTVFFIVLYFQIILPISLIWLFHSFAINYIYMYSICIFICMHTYIHIYAHTQSYHLWDLIKTRGEKSGFSAELERCKLLLSLEGTAAGGLETVSESECSGCTGMWKLSMLQKWKFLLWTGLRTFNPTAGTSPTFSFGHSVADLCKLMCNQSVPSCPSGLCFALVLQALHIGASSHCLYKQNEAVLASVKSIAISPRRLSPEWASYSAKCPVSSHSWNGK